MTLVLFVRLLKKTPYGIAGVRPQGVRAGASERRLPL